VDADAHADRASPKRSLKPTRCAERVRRTRKRDKERIPLEETIDLLVDRKPAVLAALCAA
jgi:hypothetical protein